MRSLCLVALVIGALRWCPGTVVADEPAPLYLIGPGDTLAVTVVGAPDLTEMELPVRPDGTISFPWVGELKVGGKTVSEVSDTIAAALSKRYRHVSVTVNLTQFHERTVFVLGEVLNPGAVHIEGETIDVAQAVLQAGGLTPDAAAADATLYRPGKAPEPVDLAEAMAEGGSGIVLRPSDALLVEPRKPDEITILGEVAEPGIHPLPPDARLDSVLAVGGAPTESGDARRAILVRDDGQTTIVDIEHLMTHPDSPVNVPLDGYRMFVVPPKAELVVSGEVESPDTYPAGSQTRLFDIITAAGGLTEKADPQKTTVVNRDGQLLEVDLEQALAHPESEANILLADVSLIVVGEDTRRYEVTVLGEVTSPKAIPTKESIPLPAALAQAGSLTERADPRKIQVIRADGGQETIDAAFLLGLKGPGAQSEAAANVVLRPGDLVIVNRRYARVVTLGGVESPGSYEFEEGDTAVEAIAKAGGFRPKAVRASTAILRRQTDAVQVISLDMRAALRGSEALLSEPLQDRDIVYVPEGKRAAWRDIIGLLFGAAAFVRVFAE